MRPVDAPIVTAAAMRAAEAACFARGVAQSDLMERAGAAVARQAARFAHGRPIAIMAGPGNNGGDAFVAARLLAEWGHDVVVGVLEGARQDAAAAMRAAWTRPTTALSDLPGRPIVVDGLFGIGLLRPIDREAAASIDRLRAAASFVLAIDIASGLDADSGAALGTVMRADATLALGAVKRGHVQGAGIAATGALLLDPLDIGATSMIRMLDRATLTPPAIDAHKYTRGLVGVVGGAMPGAARLAAAAAARGGAGYVVVEGADARVPFDAIVHRDAIDAAKARAIVIGPGLGRDDDARKRCEQWLAGDCPLVIDGDALSLIDLATIAARRAPTILTPHGGEFASLFGAPEGDRIAATIDAAAATGAVVVHKGPATIIADPAGDVRVVNPPRWLSTAGTGDVLAGLVAARLAVGGSAMRAACEAAWLHSAAARLAGPAFVADDLIMHIPEAIRSCL